MNNIRQIIGCVLILVLSSPFTLFGQETGDVRGVVTLSDGAAAENISVMLRGTSYGTVTDSDGRYELKNVKVGRYQIRISAVGVEPLQAEIEVTSGQVATRDFKLAFTQQQLKEVEVNFFATQSETVAKMPLKNLENAQVYHVVSDGLIKEQVVTNFDDALKNVPGLEKLWESTGRSGDGGGYYSLRGFNTQATIKNGLPNFEFGIPDVANIESIEVLKGPSGTLYGSTLVSYGGLVNINTKKPFGQNAVGASFTGGSYDQYRGTLDVNRVISTDKGSAVRLNAAYTSQGSFQDAGRRKSALVAPSLLLKANERLSFLLNTEFTWSKGTNPTMLFADRSNPLRYTSVNELGYDINRSYTDNSLEIANRAFQVQAQARYQFNDRWHSQTAFSFNNSQSDGYYTYLYEGTAQIEAMAEQAGTPIAIDGHIFARMTSKQDAQVNGYDIQQNFVGQFHTGSVKHRLLLGADYYHRGVKADNGVYGNQGFIYIGDNKAQFQALVPLIHGAYNSPYSLNEQGDDSGVLTPEGIEAVTGGVTSPAETKLDNYSIYVSDVVNVLPNLLFNAALRVDAFDNHSSDTKVVLSPKFGVVYQPLLDQVAIFANYQNGFGTPQQVTNYVDGAPTVVYLDPERANQWEGGVKLNLLKDRFSATASYYDIRVTDKSLFVGDFTNGYYTQDATQRSKGVELSVVGTPLDGWNVIAGYANNDSKMEKADADYIGRRPEEAGPRHLANLWTSYTFTRSAVKGLGFGVGANYGSSYATLNRATTGELYLPEYTVLNATAFYTFKQFRIGFKIDNLTDEVYYKGWSTINPQNRRSILGTLAVNL